MKVNGTYMLLDEVLTLFDFLQTRNFNINRIAVERNGEIVPRSTYKMVILKDDDILEIVSFVGGG